MATSYPGPAPAHGRRESAAGHRRANVVTAAVATCESLTQRPVVSLSQIALVPDLVPARWQVTQASAPPGRTPGDGNDPPGPVRRCAPPPPVTWYG